MPDDEARRSPGQSLAEGSPANDCVHLRAGCKNVMSPKSRDARPVKWQRLVPDPLAFHITPLSHARRSAGTIEVILDSRSTVDGPDSPSISNMGGLGALACVLFYLFSRSARSAARTASSSAPSPRTSPTRFKKLAEALSKK